MRRALAHSWLLLVALVGSLACEIDGAGDPRGADAATPAPAGGRADAAAPAPRRDAGGPPETPAPTPTPTPTPTPAPAPQPGAGGCPVTRPGASGAEKDGTIPVCCVPAASDKALIDEVFRLLNEHRMASGRTPLMYDEALERAIQGHCKHMAEHTFFDHSAPEPEVASFTARARLCGSSASGENIAYNQANPAAVMRTWIGSSGHNANMLNAGYRRVGICHYQRRWGQIFAR